MGTGCSCRFMGQPRFQEGWREGRYRPHMVSFSSRTLRHVPLPFRLMDQLREDRGAHFDSWLLDMFEIGESDVELMVDHANSEKEA